MESTAKKEESVEVKSEVKKNAPTKKPFSHIYIMLGVLGFVFLSVLLIFLLVQTQSKKSQNQSQIPTPTPQQVVVPTITPQVSPVLQEMNIYSVNTNTMSKIARILPEKGFQGQSPVLDPSGFLYYIDQNRVMQFSIISQDAKVVYTNTKPFTEIANITFITPSLLYISVILDPFNPNYANQLDHSSYVTELNMQTNAIRTIGPLPTLTSGYISYLFSAQHTDIINQVTVSYCKGDGDIYQYSSGSATFVAKNGFGCNGSAPYLVGTIENGSQLVLADPGTNVAPDDFISTYGNLHTINVTNGNDESIYDLNSFTQVNGYVAVPDMPNQINKFAISEDKQTVFYLLGTKIYSIDVINRKLTQTTDVSQLAGYSVIAIANKKIYLLNTVEQNLAIVDTLTNAVAVFPQNSIGMINNTMKYLGLWNNQLLFYVAQIAH